MAHHGHQIEAYTYFLSIWVASTEELASNSALDNKSEYQFVIRGSGYYKISWQYIRPPL